MTESGAPPEFSSEFCNLAHSGVEDNLKRIDSKVNGLIILLSTGALSVLMFLLKEVITRFIGE